MPHDVNHGQNDAEPDAEACRDGPTSAVVRAHTGSFGHPITSLNSVRRTSPA
jgi:hypothetical protein